MQLSLFYIQDDP